MSTPGPRVVPPGPAPAGLRALGADVVRVTRGHHLALCAAGVTSYGAIGAVPLLLLSLGSPGCSPARARRRGAPLGEPVTS